MLCATIPAPVCRILAQLERAEAREPDPHMRDDYRIAWLTALYAARGDYSICGPHVAASYMVLGLHPDKVWPAIVARRRALLGTVSAEFAGERLPPKKGPARVAVCAVGRAA